MTNTCPVPTPAERLYGDIQRRLQADLLSTVYDALHEATAKAQAEIQAAGLTLPPLPFGFFAASLHQHLFCTLCGADPETFSGGRADVARAVIRNAQNIANLHWAANIETGPQA